MINGFIKVAAATPEVRVADVEFNADKIIRCITKAENEGARLIVLPELAVTAYTCGDLFLQSELIRRAENALIGIVNATKDLDILCVAGLPVSDNGKLYNCAAFFKDGNILGFVTKTNIPNYSEFYEMRHFNTMAANSTVYFGGMKIPIGPKLIFVAKEMPEFAVAADICEDLWASNPPSNSHTENGATIIVNLSASDEVIGKSSWRRKLVEVQSAKTESVYIYADAGEGESSTDMTFSGHNMIYEAGTVLAESKIFSESIIYADVDVERCIQERRRVTTFKNSDKNDYQIIYFNTAFEKTNIRRKFDRRPFVPENDDNLRERCEEIFAIQYHGLKKRLKHIGIKTVTIGISGGLDSTLALLVAAKAFDDLGLPKSGIIAVTMPCFGTTDRTYNNAVSMIKSIGATFKEVNIKAAVTQHMSDIGADINVHDVTYENAQARERTQVLMDIANKSGGIVIGTGDLSELALGFATYNGDHMSMYGVNASVPKTLVRYLVKYIADTSSDELKNTLYDVLDTPVSPELLPPEDGQIVQQTEEIVGPYELHDFFLYNMVRWGFSKNKVYRMAKLAFVGVYDKETIKKWLDIFVRRFYNSQFKRSCIPDGVKVGSVSLSPRGDWRMPSDAVCPKQ
ncbi:MAG: NAD(+) synthase [Monoglobaceae bacterium]